MGNAIGDGCMTMGGWMMPFMGGFGLLLLVVLVLAAAALVKYLLGGRRSAAS